MTIIGMRPEICVKLFCEALNSLAYVSKRKSVNSDRSFSLKYWTSGARNIDRVYRTSNVCHKFLFFSVRSATIE